MTVSRNSSSAAVILVVAVVCYVSLGNAVAHVPPMGIDAAARPITGEAPGIATIFTGSCLWPALTTLGAIGALIALRSREWRGRIVFAIGTTLAGWLISNMCKDIFARPRPAYWIVHHETSMAYSSGHALFATIVYWLWAYHVARSDAPAGLRIPLCAGLALWGAGVIWSRLALGAHYPSDLVGGVLLGAALLALARLVATVVAPRARVL